MEKKLINIQNKLKNKDIGINEIKKVNDDYSKLIKKILELDKIFKDGYALIKKIKYLNFNLIQLKKMKI